MRKRSHINLCFNDPVAHFDKPWSVHASMYDFCKFFHLWAVLSVFSAVPRKNEVLHLSYLIRQKFVGPKFSWIFLFTFRGNFVILICTEYEVESYCDSSAKICFINFSFSFLLSSTMPKIVHKSFCLTKFLLPSRISVNLSTNFCLIQSFFLISNEVLLISSPDLAKKKFGNWVIFCWY